MTIAHPDYAQLAARIAISNLHSNTKKSFSDEWYDKYKMIMEYFLSYIAEISTTIILVLKH
jgi:hypothetical protein